MARGLKRESLRVVVVVVGMLCRHCPNDHADVVDRPEAKSKSIHKKYSCQQLPKTDAMIDCDSHCTDQNRYRLVQLNLEDRQRCLGGLNPQCLTSTGAEKV